MARAWWVSLTGERAMLSHPTTPSLYPWAHRGPPSPLTHPTKIPLELRMRPTSTRRQMMTSSNSRPRYPSHLWTHTGVGQAWRRPGEETAWDFCLLGQGPAI